jgi:hypothetical protein
LPKKARNRDGVYERNGRPGYWISFVDEYGKRRQQYGGPTLTQAREKREETRTRVREVQDALANGAPLPTQESFAAVAKRYIDYQQKRCSAGGLSRQELTRQTGIVETPRSFPTIQAGVPLRTYFNPTACAHDRISPEVPPECTGQ